MTNASKSAALSQSASADALAASFTTLILGGTAGFSMPLLAAGAYSAGLGAGAGAVSGSGGRVGTLPVMRSAGGDGASLPIWSSTPPTVGVPGSSGDPRMPAPRLPSPPIHVDMSNFMAGATLNGDKSAAQEIASTVSAMMPSIVNQIRRANFQDSRLYGDYLSAVS